MTAVETESSTTEESWTEARKIAGLVSNVSALFSTAIRFLRKDAEAKLPTMSRSSGYAVERLLSSASFKAPTYYAALTFKPEAILNATFISPRQLAEIFAPAELANLIGLLYLYRRIQKGVDESEWSEIAKLVHTHGQMGGQLGVSMKNIGLANGLLLGTVRHLSLGLFAGIQKKAFSQYRRNLKIQKRDFDLAEERKIWGCTHLEVGSILVQSLGLGGDTAKALTNGLLMLGIADKQLDTDSYRMRIGWMWIRSLLLNGSPPDITHRGDFYPMKAELAKLTEQANELRTNGYRHPFYAKGKEDLSPELTPALFKDSTAIHEISQEEIPSEVAKELGDVSLEVEDI
ncbi:MAG: hypothetical protein EBZ48_03090 [Proteobacteria bacterium]|nr:hypothetical protein [Pseudomonadota bacterium]